MLQDDIPYSDLGEGEIRLVNLHAGDFESPVEVSSFNADFSPTLHREGFLNSEATAESSQPTRPSDFEHFTTLGRNQFRAASNLDASPIISRRYFSRVESQSRPRFEALSYIWGSGDSNSSINIRVNHTVRKYRVRKALELALRHLRNPDEDRTLYIDFLSINQYDEDEKSRQITMFSDVFHNAFNVCIWLGEAADDSDFAMDFIFNILNFRQFNGLSRDAKYRRHWLAFSKLIGRTWFQRRWIVQEMALARAATVHCGTKWHTWSDFTDALALFESQWSDVYQLLFPDQPLEIGDVQPPGATNLVAISANIFRKNERGDIKERRYNMENLLAMLPIFRVSHPLDGVYSVIALAKDGFIREVLAMDYSADVISEYAAVIDHIIATSGKLDIICRSWAEQIDRAPPNMSGNLNEEAYKCPTWITTVEKTAFVRRPDGQYDRQNADSLVGLPGRCFYNAAAGTTTMDNVTIDLGFKKKISAPLAEYRTITLENATVDLGSRERARVPYVSHLPDDVIPLLAPEGARLEVTSEHSRQTENHALHQITLTARGFQIDEVMRDGGPSYNANIPEKWQILAGWRRQSRQTVPNEFWRTIVVDRTADGSNPPNWWGRACDFAFNLVNTKHISITQLLAMCKEAPHVQECLRRIQASIWSRNMFLTKKEKALGIGPSSIEVGDWICILYGCSVPVVLRKREEDGRFEFIGECFVYGLMEGQALELRDKKDNNDDKEREFVLV